MYHCTLFLLLASAFPALTKPLTTTLSRRDPCDGVDASPVLYHEYRSDECPPIHKFDPDRPDTCLGMNHIKNDCTAFCQVRTNFYYGREQPFPNAYCRGPLSCSISESHSVSVTHSVNVSPKVGKAFKLGISGSYSWGSSDGFARSYSIDLKAGSCGYFSFVPVMKETCGTLSESFNHIRYCDKDAKNTQNACAEQIKQNSVGNADGETIFVRTDCITREPLDHDQDPIYSMPGVALPRYLYNAYAEAWGNGDVMSTSANDDIKCDTVSDDTPKLKDCIHAIGTLTMFADYKIDYNKDHVYWPGYVLTCSVVVKWDEDAEGCTASYADAAVAAYDIIDKCTTGDQAAGMRTFKTGKCKSTIHLMNTSHEKRPY